MNEWIGRYWSRLKDWWGRFSRRQQVVFLATFVVAATVLTVVLIWLTRPEYEVAFYDLEPADAGVITERLTEMEIPYRVSEDGTSVSVPKVNAAEVKVQLADVVDSGSIGYDVFMQNLSLGMTQEQFKVLERGAIEGELEQLIKQIQGVRQANVMITMPEESIWLREPKEMSTASVVLELEPGVTLEPQQVNSLYHLISKSVPNLPEENISVVDQQGMPLSTSQHNSGALLGSAYEQQESIRLQFQQGLEWDIQQTLGMIYGPDKIMVQVFANLNFDQEKRQEELVEPVVDDEGLPVSEESIEESATGDAAGAGGIVGTGTGDVPRYVSEGSTGAGSYERIEDRVNYEVNRISREVIASLYRVEDISISVWFEPPEGVDPNVAEEDRVRIENMLSSIVSAALAGSGQEITPLDVQSRIAVDYRMFEGVAVEEPVVRPLYLWSGIVAAVLLLGIGVGAFWWLLKRRSIQEEEEQTVFMPPSEGMALRVEEADEAKMLRQLQETLKKQPEEFIDMFRRWLHED